MIKFKPMFSFAILLLTITACEKKDFAEDNVSMISPSEATTSISQNLSTTTLNTFTLVNADTDKDEKIIVNGGKINLALLTSRKINIRANLNPAGVKSVVWKLSGTQSINAIEGSAPYALFGDVGDNYNPGTLNVGSYQLVANSYSLPNGKGNLLKSISSNFTVIDDINAIEESGSTTAINTLTLINAETNSDIKTIVNGETIDLSKLPTNKLNIRANFSPTGVGSVRWALSGQESKTAIEGSAPFALFGDVGDNYNQWTPQIGSYTVQATPYSLSNGSGTAGISINVQFNIVNGTTSTEQPVTSTNLLLYSDFENTNSLNAWYKEIARSSALTISNTVKRAGNSSVRFELDKSDVSNYNGMTRAEIKQLVQKTDEQWFGFSAYLPNDFIKDPVPEIIAQWHAMPDLNLGEQWINPPLALTIKDDKIFVDILYNGDKVTKPGGFRKVTYQLGSVERNKWVDWTFRIKWSYGQDGIVEIYKNKTQLVNYRGPVGFNDAEYPYFKIGVYKWGWNGASASTSTTSKRVLFFDEVRIGDKTASLNAVSPN